MNPARDFVDQCMIVEEGAQAGNTATYKEYQRWAAENGLRYPLTQKSFTLALKALGYVPDRDMRRRFWWGLRIPNEGELF